MSDKKFSTDEYRAFIQDVKQLIQLSQIKVTASVNRNLPEKLKLLLSSIEEIETELGIE